MPKTVSNLRYTASHWVSPATAIHESLGKDEVPGPGSLRAMERFFAHLMAGAILDQGRMCDKKIRYADATSALAVGYDVFSAIYAINPPLHRMECRAKMFRNILKRIREKKSLPDPDFGRVELGRLQKFLAELITQGERQRASRIVLT